MTAATLSKSDASQNVSRIVRMLMALKGWEQQELAARLDRSQPTVSKLLRGQLRWSLDDIVVLSSAFEQDPGIFFEPADELIKSRCFSQLPVQQVLEFPPTVEPVEQLAFVVTLPDREHVPAAAAMSVEAEAA